SGNVPCTKYKYLPSGDQSGKCECSPSGAAKICRPPVDCPGSVTNNGSPGPGVWYASRAPSADHANSAAPSRYGRGSPPKVGTAHIPILPPLLGSGVRTQYVASDPSGENPSVRTDGFTNSGALP